MKKLNLDIDLLTSAINQTIFINNADNSQTNIQDENLSNDEITSSSCFLCNNSCSGFCSGSCKGTCERGCYGSCDGSCKGYCSHSCWGTCENSCKSSCDNT